MIRWSVPLMGEASGAMTTSSGPGAPTSGTSTSFTTSAGRPKACSWIAFTCALPRLGALYTMRYITRRLSSSREEPADLPDYHSHLLCRGLLLRHSHQAHIGRHDRPRDRNGVEVGSELRT